MYISKPVITVVAMLLLIVSSVLAVCVPNAITKWSQYPDQTADGVDIRMDRQIGMVRRTLADDFLCTKTGLITCVKFWGSWDKDEKTSLTKIHLSFHEDVPATYDAAGNELTFSHPGNLLWSGDFLPAQFTETLFADLCSDPMLPTCVREGFWDPSDTPEDPHTPSLDCRPTSLELHSRFL